MSTARISYAKTEALLGESIDVVEDGWLVDDDSRRTSFSEPQGHMSSSTAAGAGSGNRPELTRRVLASQAKVYRELEGLIRVLCAFQDWRVVIDQQPTYVTHFLLVFISFDPSWTAGENILKKEVISPSLGIDSV